MKKIAIIGIGGRTGAMFAFELKNAAEVLGIGKKKDVELIQEKKLYIKREGSPPKLFEVNAIKDTEFPGQSLPEIIFLATKNPVGQAVEYYYSSQRIKTQKKMPALVLSQNGLGAGEEAKKTLERILGKRTEEVQIIRVSLLNAVENLALKNKIYIGYSLPIRLCFGVFSGPKETKELLRIFKKARIKAEKISSEKVKNMEFSKLFLNLIGMASASKDLSLKDGFSGLETFKEEVLCLREYIRIVKAAGGNFLNLSRYPVKLFAYLVEKTPLSILILLRKKIWQIINKGRGGREKGNLDEIDYYQGEVVKLGKKIGIPTPVNEEILKRVKKMRKET